MSMVITAAIHTVGMGMTILMVDMITVEHIVTVPWKTLKNKLTLKQSSLLTSIML